MRKEINIKIRSFIKLTIDQKIPSTVCTIAFLNKPYYGSYRSNADNDVIRIEYDRQLEFCIRRYP